VINLEAARPAMPGRLGRRLLIAASILGPIAFVASCVLGLEIAVGPASERDLFEFHWHRPVLKVLALIVAAIVAGLVVAWKLRGHHPRIATASAVASLACSALILVPIFVDSFLGAV
jgi:hypothetical protein